MPDRPSARTPALAPAATPPSLLMLVRLLARQAVRETLTAVEVTADAPLLTVEQVAETLGCSVRSIRRMIDLGEFPVVRIGRLVRVDPDDLRRFIATRHNV